MKLICIKCPKGCEISVDGESIKGYSCPRGIEYVKEELSNPMRTVTAIVKTKYGVVPVKTSKDVPKAKIKEILKEISKIKVESTQIGDILIKNVLDTGADIVVTGNAYCK